MKTLKTILVIAGGSCLGCSVLSVLFNFLPGMKMPTAAFGYAGLAMLVSFLLLEVSELRDSEEIWDVFRKCIHSDIAAINAKISDLLMPGGTKEAHREMLKQWIMAHAVEALDQSHPDFTMDYRFAFRYKYQGKWEQSSVFIPGSVMATGVLVDSQGGTIMDHVVVPYSAMLLLLKYSVVYHYFSPCHTMSE